MTIKDILTPERVLPAVQGSTKAEVIGEFAAILESEVPEMDAVGIAGVLLQRERLNSTAIGDGIAIPHGRVGGISNVVAAFGRSPGGVEFDSVDRKPTHLFFVLLAPEEAAALHLKALARISRLLKDAHFRNRLLGLEDREQLFDAIVSEDAKV